MSNESMIHEKATGKVKNSENKNKIASAETMNISNGDESRSSPSLADEDYIVFCFKDGEIDLEEISISQKQSKIRRFSSDDVCDIKEIAEEEASTKWRSLPTSLSESTPSFSSSRSFAFPVMNWELKGSPERMPKLEEWCKARVLQPQEELPLKGWRRYIRFHCCGF